MKKILGRFTSRKFWLTVASFITMIVNEQYTEAMAIILGYVGIEGAADIRTRAVTAQAEAITTMSHNEDAPDTGQIVTGTGRIIAVDEEVDE